jgi:hypothetical protein
LKAKPSPAGTTPIPLSCLWETIVTVTSPLTRARIELVFSGGPPGEQAAQLSRAEKAMTGFEIRQIVDPTADPRTTAKQVRPAFERPPISAKT